MPSLLNYSDFCEELKEITTTKIMDKKKFHAEGLFSEQIFGPLKNYTCQCNTYYGPSGAGGTCGQCGVDVVNSDERRRRFAKIVLPIPVINPLFYDLLTELGGAMVRDGIREIMKDENNAIYWNEEDLSYCIATQDTIPDDMESWSGLDAVYHMISSLAESLVEDGMLEWELVVENIDQLIIHQIIVLPPDLRPASKGVSKNDQIVDRINRFYMQVLTKKEAMRDTIVDIRRDKSLYFNYYKQIQKDVNELYSHILEKLSKKEGLIRGNILGKRIDFSGRSVIVPDPTLSLDECCLPYVMFLELFKLQISKRLIEIGKYKLLNQAIDFVDQCVDLNIPVLFKICQELAEGEVCLLNRQPSLHRLNMLGFSIKISLDAVIKIHPLVCPPFNADFDGDQMAVYIPISEDTKQEVRDRLFVTKNLTNPSNGSLSTTPSQDIVLGIYALSNHRFPNLQSKVTYKNKEITEDIMLINECFPEDYPLITTPIDSKFLNGILNDIKEKYSNEITAESLDKVKMLGFKYSTLFGATLSLDSCYFPEAADMKKVIYDTGSITDKLHRISSDETTELLKENFFYSYMIESGARGSWDQVRQIVLTRGFISNFKGQIIPEPIVHSFLNGLTSREFFNSTYGSRKGLLDVALNTGVSGYLSRKLIFTCANLQLDDSIEDCGTTDTLEVFVTNIKKAQMLIGKYVVLPDNVFHIITKENCKELIGDTIQVRTPIYCKNPNVCNTCYGDMRHLVGSRFVGVIAAQSLGECNTQLVLRTFHTSGVAVLSENGEENEEHEQELKQADIVSDLSMASKLLHQFKGANPVALTHKLFEVYNTSRAINHVHFECIVSQLMWYGIKKWRLIPTRDQVAPEYHSVQTVPSFESWLMGLAFSNPKKHIIKGILHPGLYRGVMDKILCGEGM